MIDPSINVNRRDTVVLGPLNGSITVIGDVKRLMEPGLGDDVGYKRVLKFTII